MNTEVNVILYEEMIENMQEGIILINAKGTIIRMNNVAMRLLGTEGNVVGGPYALLMADNEKNDEFHEIVLSAIYERKRVSGCIVKLADIQEAEGSSEEIWVSVSASYLNSEVGKAVVIVMEDVTGINELRDARIALNKIRALNVELEAAKNEAIQANMAKSRFISTVSHEIRTPINAVLGMNEMILREAQDVEILNYASNIQSAGKTLHLLINDILDMSKLEAGRMELNETEYELKQLLQELWGLIVLRAREKGLDIFFHVDEKIPARLYGDDMRIKQIITNLLTNAVKYTQKGKVDLELTYKEGCDGQEDIELVVAVRDTGIGIREEDKDAVFESFKRLDLQKNKNIEGTGLGMNITMSLLKLMDGHLVLESVYQQGSTFTVIIPQKVCGKECIGKFEVQNNISRVLEDNRSTIYAPEAKILVVDDNSMNLQVAKGLLKRTGMQVYTAESGVKALEIVQETDFDLILMDHQMPEMDGIETLQALQGIEGFQQEKTPVIMLTANAGLGLVQFYHKVGFDDILTKPIEPMQLESMLVKFISKDKQQRGLRNCVNSGQLEEKDRWKEQLQNYGICLEAGLGRLHGNLKMYVELVNIFVGLVDETLNKLEYFLQTDDVAGYKICVHGLKGNAATLGAEQLVRCAAEHEKMAQKGKILYLKDHYKELRDITVRVKKVFVEMVQKKEVKSVKEAVVCDLEQWMNTLQEIINMFRCFELDDAIELLKKVIQEQSWFYWEEMLNNAYSAVINEYDDEKAMDILIKLMKGDLQ